MPGTGSMQSAIATPILKANEKHGHESSAALLNGLL